MHTEDLFNGVRDGWTFVSVRRSIVRFAFKFAHISPATGSLRQSPADKACFCKLFLILHIA